MLVLFNLFILVRLSQLFCQQFLKLTINNIFRLSTLQTHQIKYNNKYQSRNMTQTVDNSFTFINIVSNQLSKNTLNMGLCEEHYSFKKQYVCLDHDCPSKKQVELFCSECIKQHYKNHSKENILQSTKQNNIHIVLGKVKTKIAMTITQFRSLYIQKVKNSSQNYACKINSSRFNNPESRSPLPKQIPFGQLSMVLYNLINEVVQNIKKLYEQKHAKAQSGLKVLYDKNQNDLQQLFNGENLEELKDKIQLGQKLESQLQFFKKELNQYTNQTQKQSGSQLSRLIYDKINQSLKDLFMVQQNSSLNQTKNPQYLTPKLDRQQNIPKKITKKAQLNSNVLSFYSQNHIENVDSGQSFQYENQLENLRSVIRKNIEAIADKDIQISDLSKQLNKQKVANKNLASRLKQFKKLDQKFLKVQALGQQLEIEGNKASKLIDKTKSQALLSSPKKEKLNQKKIDSQSKGGFDGLNGNVMVQKNTFIRKSKQPSRNSSRNDSSNEQKNELSFNSIYEAPENRNAPSRLTARKGQK